MQGFCDPATELSFVTSRVLLRASKVKVDLATVVLLSRIAVPYNISIRADLLG